ncbi:MAG TPA: Crp/Fnr family transcriptional regulator [Solirubrobacteraceae bacterium]|nr:Crp/Fnr family transcriptional regulator [Solirubrobacteraceae bacterium]
MSSTAEDDRYYDLLVSGRPTQSLAAGEVLFGKGDPGESMYVVREGSISLRDGDREVSAVQAPGLLGEMALVDDEARTLTAVAAADAVVVEIPMRHFWILVHDTPYFAQMVMRVMARRLRARDGLT